MQLNLIGEEIIGAAIEVHRTFGPGMLESTYEACLCHELRLRGLRVQNQHPVDIEYKGLVVRCAYRLDVLVEERIVLELKTVKELNEAHRAQHLTYLRAARLPLGYLLNFSALQMKEGVKRHTFRQFAKADEW